MLVVSLYMAVNCFCLVVAAIGFTPCWISFGFNMSASFLLCFRVVATVALVTLAKLRVEHFQPCLVPLLTCNMPLSIFVHMKIH